MANIEPFRGIRYNTARIEELSTLISPPYDIIDQQEQDSFYNQNPYNIIRLEYGREKSGDRPDDNRYTRANRTFTRWQEQGILQLEDRPVFYLYRQSFSYQGRAYRRIGIFAALRVEPYHTKAVLPHEKTLSKPKTDRLELLKSCRAGFSPIFVLYPDRENKVEHICNSYFSRPPLLSFQDRGGQEHSLWTIADPAQIKGLQGLIAPLSLLIADGHHRYETALRFSREADAGGKKGYFYAMAALVNLHSPGLLMLPTHRLLKGLSVQQEGSLIEIASRSFDLQFRDLPGNLSESALFPELSQPGRTLPALGLILADRLCLLTLKSPLYEPGSLDVTLLQDRVFQPLFAGSPAGSMEKAISYSTDQQDIAKSVVRGEAQAGFILNPTPIEKVIEMAEKGEMMPQKSSYFYPKLPSGLVIYSLEKSL